VHNNVPDMHGCTHIKWLHFTSLSLSHSLSLSLFLSLSRREYNGKQRHAEDVDLVLRRAASVGVTRSILTAGNVEESTKALNYVTHAPSLTKEEEEEALEGTSHNNNNGLYSTVGIHPTRCNEFTEKGEDVVMEQLEALLVAGRAAGKVVAVGECGLDYDRLHFCDKEQQMIGFLLQFELAER
jgi:TatD DNase family protein